MELRTISYQLSVIGYQGGWGTLVQLLGISDKKTKKQNRCTPTTLITNN